MRTFTVTADGRILDYIAIHAFDYYRDINLEDWMFHVGLLYVPLSLLAKPEDSEAMEFSSQEIQQMQLGSVPELLLPKKLMSIPGGEDGSILVLIQNQVAIIEERGERGRRGELIGGGRTQTLIDMCYVRKPFTKDEWARFFVDEFGLKSSHIKRNSEEPEWTLLIENRSNFLVVLPPSSGFEIVCGYIESSRTKPTQYAVYRYDNFNGRLKVRNSLAVAMMELGTGKLEQVKRLEERLSERIKKLEID